MTSFTPEASEKFKMDRECISDYTKFDSESFLKVFYSELRVDPTFGEFWIKEMQWLHEAFQTSELECRCLEKLLRHSIMSVIFHPDGIKGQRLLDIGTGPTIHTLISASAHVDSVILSDFAPQNREVLKQWLGETLDHDFQSYFKYVVDMEKNGECPKDREMRMRKKIFGICHIDLLKDEPLGPSFFPQFDVITSSLCFVSVAESHEMYETIAKRVTNMLRVGGHLLLFSENGAESYQVGKLWFKSLETDGETVRRIWSKCGFELIDWKEESVENFEKPMMYYLMVAKKIKAL